MLNSAQKMNAKLSYKHAQVDLGKILSFFNYPNQAGKRLVKHKPSSRSAQSNQDALRRIVLINHNCTGWPVPQTAFS